MSALAPQNLLGRGVVLVVVAAWALLFSRPVEPHDAMIVMQVRCQNVPQVTR